MITAFQCLVRLFLSVRVVNVRLSHPTWYLNAQEAEKYFTATTIEELTWMACYGLSKYIELLFKYKFSHSFRLRRELNRANIKRPVTIFNVNKKTCVGFSWGLPFPSAPPNPFYNKKNKNKKKRGRRRSRRNKKQQQHLLPVIDFLKCVCRIWFYTQWHRCVDSIVSV